MEHTKLMIIIGVGVAYWIYELMTKEQTPRAIERKNETPTQPIFLEHKEIKQPVAPAASPSAPREIKISENVYATYCCPITTELMIDPVMTSNGQTYERLAIESWFRQGHNTDPVTNTRLSNLTLTPNHALKSLINEYQQQPRIIVPYQSTIIAHQPADIKTTQPARAHYPDLKEIQPSAPPPSFISVEPLNEEAFNRLKHNLFDKLNHYATSRWSLTKHHILSAKYLMNSISNQIICLHNVPSENHDKHVRCQAILEIIDEAMTRCQSTKLGGYHKAVYETRNRLYIYLYNIGYRDDGIFQRPNQSRS